MLADKVNDYTRGHDKAVAAAVEQATARVPALATRLANTHNLRCEIVAAQSSDPHLPQRVRDLIRAHPRLSAEVVRVPALPDGPTIDDQRDWS